MYFEPSVAVVGVLPTTSCPPLLAVPLHQLVVQGGLSAGAASMRQRPVPAPPSLAHQWPPWASFRNTRPRGTVRLARIMTPVTGPDGPATSAEAGMATAIAASAARTTRKLVRLLPSVPMRARLRG